MPEQPLLLGVDLGTTAIKGSLYSVDGAHVASASREYALSTPRASEVEVAPSVYWQAFTEVVGELLRDPGVDPEHVDAIGISAQGETLLLLGAHDEPLHNAVVWLDGRASEEAAELEEMFGRQAIYEATGQPAMVPTWPASKVLWFSRHEPSTWERVARVLLLEDYFVLKLTGECVCEGSLATSTCYWDFRRKIWWNDMLDALRLSTRQLPAIVEPGTFVGTIHPTVAQELGLSARTRVCTGALDQACGAIGVGNVRPGVVSDSTGTAVAICATLDGPRLDPLLRMPCHYHGVPRRYMFHTFTSGGILLRWLRDEFCAAEQAGLVDRSDAYDAMTASAAGISPGADGVIVLPYLQGAMAPESNPNARSAIVGLSLGHRRAHVIRAALESIAFVIRRNLEVLEELNVAIESVIALGGGSRSPLWKQIEADVIKRPVTTTRQPEAATLGACVLAGYAVGHYSSVVEASEAMVRIDRTFEPDKRNAGIYDDTYEAFRATYEVLVPIFDKRIAAHVAA